MLKRSFGHKPCPLLTLILTSLAIHRTLVVKGDKVCGQKLSKACGETFFGVVNVSKTYIYIYICFSHILAQNKYNEINLNFFILASHSYVGSCKLENEILKEAKNRKKLPKMILLRPENVIFERFWPLSKFNFLACSTLVMSHLQKQFLISTTTS